MPKPYEKNAKKHPDKQLKKIADSLKTFGWRQPIVVDKNDVIIVGHGRWMAYKKFPEGIAEPRVEKADDLSDEQVKAYRLADNKLNESEWDMDFALEDLKGLSPELFMLTGFDKDLLLEPENKDEINPVKTWTDPVTGKFAKGNPGGGRPNGSLDFKTKWLNVIEKIAKQNSITVEEVDEQLVLTGYKKAKEGDYSFYRDTMDRLHGRPVAPVDITTGGEKINTVDPKAIALAQKYEEELKKGL